MKKDSYVFPALFDYDEDGISISFPDLPGCLSCADSDDEALYMAKDALRCWLLTAEEYGDDIPAPSSLKDVITLSGQKSVLVEVCLAPYREAYKNRSVKKTLTIPAWLNDVAEKEKINFSFVLQNALKEQLNIQN